MQVMRMLARYMAYMMKSFALARENGLLPPDMEKPKKRTPTSFDNRFIFIDEQTRQKSCAFSEKSTEIV